jgi:DNA-binding response OmpR family regulator
MADSPPYTVAIFNASDDTVEMLQTKLSLSGCRAIPGTADSVKSGELDFVEFLSTHRPDGIIWDIAPPYERNWNFFKLLRSARPLDHCHIVLTTTHKQHLDTLAGHDTGAIEIIGKPYDLQVIVDEMISGIERRRRPGPTPVAAVPPRSGEALSHRHAGADSRADVHEILERRRQD